MILKKHKQFERNYRKRIAPFSKLDQRFHDRLVIFMQNRNHLLLKDHQLIGRMLKFRAFSLGGDLRVVYFEKNNEIWLYDIGSHNQVY